LESVYLFISYSLLLHKQDFSIQKLKFKKKKKIENKKKGHTEK